MPRGDQRSSKCIGAFLTAHSRLVLVEHLQNVGLQTYLARARCLARWAFIDTVV